MQVCPQEHWKTGIWPLPNHWSRSSTHWFPSSIFQWWSKDKVDYISFFSKRAGDVSSLAAGPGPALGAGRRRGRHRPSTELPSTGRGFGFRVSFSFTSVKTRTALFATISYGYWRDPSRLCKYAATLFEAVFSPHGRTRKLALAVLSPLYICRATFANPYEFIGSPTVRCFGARQRKEYAFRFALQSTSGDETLSYLLTRRLPQDGGGATAKGGSVTRATCSRWLWVWVTDKMASERLGRGGVGIPVRRAWQRDGLELGMCVDVYGTMFFILLLVQGQTKQL